MKILVVCGAGASSTFVAQRVRRAAAARGQQLSAVAGTQASLPVEREVADVILLGPHLADAAEDIRRDAAARGIRVVLLPHDIFGDRDGTRTLALIDTALVDTEPAEAVASHPPAASLAATQKESQP
ncbi:PTS sugar transporter subunit IIB [Microbacterium sp.]|uniref:PTS sugar transporter subunit IIB n=1 Tax=Microbacterium sp. TaxID=51671 RepID=UPI0039E57063